MNPIQQALDLLRKDGWIKLSASRNGRHCVRGALQAIGHDSKVVNTYIRNAIQNHVLYSNEYRCPTCLPSLQCPAELSSTQIILWNDDCRTRFEDVEHVLTIAAKEWDRDHG